MVIMFIVKSKHYSLINIIFFSIFLYNCSLKSPDKVHGINFLENRSSVLKVNKSNKNDVVKNIGKPHSISISNENTWIYFDASGGIEINPDEDKMIKQYNIHDVQEKLINRSNDTILYIEKNPPIQEQSPAPPPEPLLAPAPPPPARTR